MFSFASPWLLLLLLIPFVMRLVPAKRHNQPVALKLPTFHLLASQQSEQKVRRFPWILYVIWSLVVIAAARPEWLGEPISVSQKGREMFIAVDLSGSMQYEDMVIGRQKVNRLVMLKHVLKDFIERREGDRLGLILFADTAYVQTPLTYDRNTIQQMLDEAVLGLVGERTAIGDALGLAAKRFNEKSDSNRVLVLVTDGQNTAGNISPDDALEIAKSAGVRVYTIGVGADEMLVRGLLGQRRVNPSSDLDEGMLRRIADQTGGQYFRARDTDGLEQIYRVLDQLEPVDADPIQLRPMQALFYWPLAIALAIACLTIVVKFIQQRPWRTKSAVINEVTHG